MPLAGESAYLVGPGDSEIGLNLATVVLVDGAWVFIFSVVLLEVGTFHLAFDTDASPVSSTGHVALARPASFNVVAPHSEEPLEDFLIPHIGSTSGVHSDFALCFAEGVVASTDWSKMIRITARSVGVAIPVGQSGRAPVLAPGSIGSGDPPTNLAYGSGVAVVVVDFAGHETDLRFRSCLPRCAYSDTKTQNFTMPMPTLTEKDRTMYGWRRRVSVSVLSMVCWYVRRSGGFGENRSRCMSKGS